MLLISGLNLRADEYDEYEYGDHIFGDYEYLIKNGTIKITQYNGSAAKLNIPSTIDGKKVTVVGTGSFSWNNSLTSVIIPDGVIRIEDEAFDCCENLKTVTIPKSVTYIGSGAFGYYVMDGDDQSLISGFVIYGFSNTYAEKYAKKSYFKFISLTPPPKKGTTKTVGKNKYVVTSKSTVRYKAPVSKKITKMKIPKTITIYSRTYKVTAIGKKAFVGCSKLKTVTINKNIKQIGKLAFYNCKKLKTVRIYSKKLTKNNVQKGAFQGIGKKAIFYLPKGKKAAYKKIFLKRGAKKNMKFITN